MIVNAIVCGFSSQSRKIKYNTRCLENPAESEGWELSVITLDSQVPSGYPALCGIQRY